MQDLEGEIQAVIEKVVAGGLGLGRTEQGVVFVPQTLPGERVTVAVTERKKDFIKGAVTHLHEPSPDRIDPPCRYYQECGGCDLQHASYESQLAIKQGILQDALLRTGGISLPDSLVPVIPSDPWGYRRRVRFHRTPEGELGFRRRLSHDVLAVDSCPVMHHSLESLLKSDSGAADTSLSVFAGDSSVAAGSSQTTITLENSRGIAHRFHLDGRVFFQSNTDALRPIIDIVSENPSGGTAVDLYSGVGTFAAFLGDSYSDVITVERDRHCLSFAKKNLSSRMQVVTGPVEQWSRRNRPGRIDRLVVDPPRSGIHSQTLRTILGWKPGEIIYVSCSPVTFARDLKIMCASGYELDKVLGIDLYPQTSHLECSARLTFIP